MRILERGLRAHGYEVLGVDTGQHGVALASDPSIRCVGELEMREQLKKADLPGLAIIALALVSFSVNSVWTKYHTAAAIFGGVLIIISLGLKLGNIRTGERIARCPQKPGHDSAQGGLRPQAGARRSSFRSSRGLDA